MRWSDGWVDGWKAYFAIIPIPIRETWIWLEWYDVSELFYANDDICWKRRYPSQIKLPPKSKEESN